MEIDDDDEENDLINMDVIDQKLAVYYSIG